ncbi:patatin-like phospholipase family protein [Variovorax sp. GT1P44]|uniref:patatin-like phospholipase family protein n=1 Tax=Variovorax sp. GT1P44 TaxID=3443742 RepID=UPI003F46B4CA
MANSVTTPKVSYQARLRTRLRAGLSAAFTASLLMLVGCANRPINPPIQQADASSGYRFETRQAQVKDKDALVILAFSGGGTRAAAFSYGVLEYLRRTEIVTPKGRGRLIGQVDIITGVSGGSFTALAYGLYGDRLFDDYEQRFLKRDVQGAIVSRSLNPGNWARLSSRDGGARSWPLSSMTKSCSTTRLSVT